MKHIFIIVHFVSIYLKLAWKNAMYCTSEKYAYVAYNGSLVVCVFSGDVRATCEWFWGNKMTETVYFVLIKT